MISEIKQYFDVEELVCPHVYKRFGEGAWQFYDERLLETLLVVREKIGKPIYVNNWAIGGNLSQRGLRCNVCRLVSEKTALEKCYMSAHIQGLAIDFDVKGMSAEEVRQWIERNQILLPYAVRIEDGVSWVHIDMRNDGTKGKVVRFKG